MSLGCSVVDHPPVSYAILPSREPSFGACSWMMLDHGSCKAHSLHRCFTEGRAAFDIAQESLWNELPRFFGLPKWEALRRMQ